MPEVLEHSEGSSEEEMGIGGKILEFFGFGDSSSNQKEGSNQKFNRPNGLHKRDSSRNSLNEIRNLGTFGDVKSNGYGYKNYSISPKKY